MTASVTYTFRNQSGPIPLSELDTNFQDLVTAINTNETATNAAIAALGGNAVQFTPGLAFNGASVGMTFSAVRYGAYVLVGNLVHYALEFRLSAKGSSTGFATITGLPFTAATNFPTGSGPWTAIQVGTVTFASGYIAGFVSPGSTTMSIANVVTAAGITANFIADTNCANTSYFACSGFYLKQ